ncbi:hypothetical protein AAE478_003586 [Parahypoxylon ruwenzoriense]
MKGSRSTCLLCRHLIAAPGRSHTSQWQAQAQAQAQATSFSTSSTVRNDNPAITATPRAPDAGRGSSNTRKVLARKSEGPSNIAWSQKRRGNPPVQDSAKVEAIFKQIVSKQTQLKHVPADTSSASATMDPALVQAIEKLKQMTEKDEAEADAYDYLKSEIYPMIRKPGIYLSPAFCGAVLKLMDKVVAAKRKAMRSPRLPSVAEIFQVYVDIGEMKPKLWATVVGELVHNIVQMDPATESSRLDEAHEEFLTRDGLLMDLVGSWKVLSLPKAASAVPDNEMIDGFWFPRPDKFSITRFSAGGDFPAAFSSIFPEYLPNQLGAPHAVLAIATYALLLDPRRSNPVAIQSAARFTTRVASLIIFVRFQDTALQEEVSRHFPKLENYVMAQWPNIKAQLKEKIESGPMSNIRAPPSERPRRTGLGDIEAFSLGSRLSRAYGLGNSNRVDELWAEFVGPSKRISPERAATVRKYPDLMDSFLNTRMALSQPKQVVEVWDTMRQVGLKPTIKTWNVMLDGCKEARNVNGIRNVWAKLARSGMKLDTKIWTTRVSGLVEAGDVQGGIQALEEMAKLWEESSKDENSTAVKPTIEPVNAALAGLIRRKQVAAAESLLAWAGRQGIEPDIFTFNSLLRGFVREGRDKDVRQLFNAMRDLDVRADEATFTIILDAAFSSIAPDNAEEQAKAVTSVLTEMESVGLEANLQTYGKIIYNLLNTGDGAKETVAAVLAHLWSKGLELSPHIYTMLVDHYFAQRPPDLVAVKTLLARRRALDYDDMDNIFYDRVIKGYARVGDTCTALDIYRRLSKAGVLVNLSTLMELLRVLMWQDRIADAQNLVISVRKMYEERHRRFVAAAGGDETETPGFWNHPFWHNAREYGLEPNGRGPPTRGARI